VGELIPFNVPYVPEISKQYVLEALDSNHQQGDGPFTVKASKMISDLVGGGHVLLTPSCTHALEMASMLADLGPGDEVILPSYTFTSAATAVTKFGATPIFVDIEMETIGIDVNHVREAITPKTKAISWVNYAGVAPDIAGLQNLAKEFDLLLIEDNAHGLGGSYNGKPLGSFGDFATQSFHATKNIQCGEGGALVINNKKFVDRAEIIREKGTNRKNFINGQVLKYQWVDNGSSYLLAESLAALLLGQLQNFSLIQSSRQSTWDQYLEFFSSNRELKPYFSALCNPNTRQVSHIFYVTSEFQKELQTKLFAMGILSQSHYQPLHRSVASLERGYNHFPNPNSIKFSENVLRMPMFMNFPTDFFEKHGI
jgi:dTDP-4-amino-4,6-dideoxygalactose transaminase